MTTESGVLVTGGKGFLGSYLVAALQQTGQSPTILGRQVESTGISRDLAEGPVSFAQPFDSVYHLAGWAHRVPTSKLEEDRFYLVNVQGTQNLLVGLEKAGRLPRSLVLISTVAVYGKESGTDLDESTPRRAVDPYGESKGQAEDLVLQWGDRHGVQIGIVRLPLVAGRNPPGNLGAMLRALRKGRYMGIGDGLAKRSIVLAGDVVTALPRVAERGGIYHLTDGHHPSFAELEASLCSVLGREAPRRLPLTVARLAGRAGDLVNTFTQGRSPITTRRVRKMTSTLTFSDEKARRELDWAPSQVLSLLEEIVGSDESAKETRE